MRGQDRVRRVEQGRSGGRLVLEDVDPGAAQAALAEGLGNGGLVDHSAAGHVEEDRIGLHPGELLRSRSGPGWPG